MAYLTEKDSLIYKQVVQMEPWVAAAAAPAETSPGPSSVKQAACLTCRRTKTRCLRNTGDTRCKKCQLAGIECVIPEFHVGRHKGVKK